jgi:hypothetical protein
MNGKTGFTKQQTTATTNGDIFKIEHGNFEIKTA